MNQCELPPHRCVRTSYCLTPDLRTLLESEYGPASQTGFPEELCAPFVMLEALYDLSHMLQDE